ncbi:aromatic amino acid exporter YddG [Pseudogemmobacter faecipullorum]|uniref:DMT family transporter n=1 Tax=Pseudogemmobacter faecipullorum TaxID=2755041 RepID=A0ABS8CHT1_9RHOB|nr:DMT family transporter [Pseudogemmobacter faecipullorum]MCB5408926.1 DMT family transporter [Pseudogemmobacter faecipullorum]
MTRTRATAIGFTAVMMWALLALLTIGSSPVPPLLLNTICFAIGGVIGLVWTARKGFGLLKTVSWKVYAFGTIGLFGYHLLYFTAFRVSPTAETGLIAYLWPLFIVLFSGLLPGEKLLPQHLTGAAIAFAGAALIIFARTESGAFNATGMALAFGCALTWSAYSVLSRRLGDVPTESVTVFCLLTALLSGLAHLALEETLWPVGPSGWLSVLLLGLGPVGAAFFTWDIGMKKGDIQLLGVASYAAPLLSTLALVVAGITQPGWTIALAALLITGGAALAARKSARG